MARAKKGSRRRQKTKADLARLCRKLANRRKTRLHQVSASLARRFGGIAVEKLQIKNMTASAKGTVDHPGTHVRQKAALNREILDTSPSMLIAMLRYKAERAGGWFAVVDASNTSQQCSRSRRTLSWTTTRVNGALVRGFRAGIADHMKRVCGVA